MRVDLGDDVVLLNLPVQSGEADCLGAGDYVLVNDGAESVPCGLAVSVERVVVLHDAVAHVVLLFLGVVLSCHMFVA